MSPRLLDRPLVPVANPDDAVATYERLRPHLLETDVVPTVVFVIEKAGGAPDRAGVEHRRDLATAAFDAFEKRARTDGIEVETDLRYGEDVAETIHDAATDIDASAIVFSPRSATRWPDFLTGSVRRTLVTDQECPVVVLPREGDDA